MAPQFTNSFNTTTFFLSSALSYIRQRGSRYRLLTFIVVICLAVFTGSYLSHGPHNQPPSDVQKRSVLENPLGFNDSLDSLPQELVLPKLISRAADLTLWAQKVTSGRCKRIELKALFSLPSANDENSYLVHDDFGYRGGGNRDV
ncbi:hypothetical protein Ptr902_13285 [Pyrenophora tritici-repentis]|nr:hypothetical protein Ptr902_13285 [Pyrenophora tritici-repentis]